MPCIPQSLLATSRSLAKTLSSAPGQPRGTRQSMAVDVQQPDLTTSPRSRKKTTELSGGPVASLKPCHCAGPGCADLVGGPLALAPPRATEGDRESASASGRHPDLPRRLISPPVYIPSSDTPPLPNRSRFQGDFIYNPYHVPHIIPLSESPTEISSLSAQEITRGDETMRAATVHPDTDRKRSFFACWPCRKVKVRYGC